MNVRPLVAAVVVFAAAAAALADHATRRLDALAADVAVRQAQSGLSRPQSRALAAAARLLARDTTTEAADVAVLARTATILARAFPRDATFGSDVDPATRSFVDDFVKDRRALSDLLDALADSTGAAAARKLYDKVEPLLVAVDFTASRARRLALLARAGAALAKAFEAAGTGSDYVIAVVDGAPFISDEAWFDSSPHALTITGTDWDQYRRPSGPAAGDWKSIVLAADRVAGTGTFPLAGDTGYAKPYGVFGDWWTWAAGEPDVGGTLVIARYDSDARIVEGTFSFSAALAPPSRSTFPPAPTTTVEATVGRFRARLP